MVDDGRCIYSFSTVNDVKQTYNCGGHHLVVNWIVTGLCLLMTADTMSDNPVPDYLTKSDLSIPD